MESIRLGDGLVMIFDKHITVHELQPQAFLLLLEMPSKDLHRTSGFFHLFLEPFLWTLIFTWLNSSLPSYLYANIFPVRAFLTILYTVYHTPCQAPYFLSTPYQPWLSS